MAKSTPEKLAAALRANLKRRKQAPPAQTVQPPGDSPAKPAKKPRENPLKNRG